MNEKYYKRKKFATESTIFDYKKYSIQRIFAVCEKKNIKIDKYQFKDGYQCVVQDIKKSCDHCPYDDSSRNDHCMRFVDANEDYKKYLLLKKTDIWKTL